MSVTVEIPADVAASIRVPPGELDERLRLELAVALYRQGLLASGKACALAGLTRWEWEDVLGRRGVARHYTGADLTEDLAHGHGGQ